MAVPLKSLLLKLKESGVIEGELHFDESLARYTSWKIGGRAESFYRPAGVKELQTVLGSLPRNVPVYWIGLGSNILIRDNGLDGLVINTRGVLNEMRIDAVNQQHDVSGTRVSVYAQAGVSCAAFSRRVTAAGLTGAEFLSGIPGTIGGALAMNAGAFGDETWHSVSQVEMINRQGNITRCPADSFEVGYRKVVRASDEWFLGATFVYLSDAEKVALNKQKIRELLDKRAETQPIGLANAGSVFKNPPGEHAARLIESCGLKGVAMNDAQVSEKHANFIINRGNARAADVEKLIALIQEKVLQTYAIHLQTEVKIIGDKQPGVRH